jgi:hypothetical protein
MFQGGYYIENTLLRRATCDNATKPAVLRGNTMNAANTRLSL